jgi:hypothetical protein
MATLWQILHKKPSVVAPVQMSTTSVATCTIPTPVGPAINLGSTVKIKTIDLEDYNFTVQTVREFTRNIDGKIGRYDDYKATARPNANDTIRAMLRLVPTDEPDHELTHDIILLNYVSGFGFDQGYTGGVKPQPSYSMASVARACLADVSRHSVATAQQL